MTTPRKTTAKPKAKLTVVDGPDMDELERFLAESAEQSAPLIKRAGLAREKQEARIRETKDELDALDARQQLATRVFEAVTHGFQLERDDLLAELDVYENGINGLSSQVAKAAAE